MPIAIAPLRLAILAATVLAYSIMFVVAYPAIGSVIASLSVLPVIAVGWWFGLRAGLCAGFAAIALNAGLREIVGEPWWTVLSAKGATGGIVVVIVGALVGHVQGTRVALARELSARVAAEAAANASASRSRAILDATTEAVIVTDEHERIVDVNRSAEQLFGSQRDELLGQELQAILRRSGDQSDDTANGPRPGVDQSATATGVKRDSLEFPAEMSTAPVHGDDSAAWVTTVRDIGDRLRDEQSLRQAQKMEAIGQLAGGIAHDFNNLLTAIGGYSDLLLLDDSLDGDKRASTIEIRRATDRASALTRQLLEFSRRQTVNREIVDLNDAVRGLEPMLRRLLGEHILIVTHFEPRLEPVFADRAQIEQVILNLAINSRDAMGEGGVLTITTGRGSSASLGERGAQRVVRLTVSDTGSGIDPAIRARIFDPFFTTKEPGKGTGLGLSSVHGIIRSFDGEILVESEPGHGSTFEVQLPAQPARSVGAAPAAALDDVPGGTELVLVVEDEPAVRQLAVRFLRARGYEVLEAGSMQEALVVSSSIPRAVDVLVTDVVMPGGGGPRLAERLRCERPDLPVLFLSGYPEIGQTSGSLKVDGPLLAKPFDSEQLARAVRAALGRPIALGADGARA